VLDTRVTESESPLAAVRAAWKASCRTRLREKVTWRR